MRLLNLGCGSHFHTDWVNIDFISHSPHVQQCDLRKGIPYDDKTFDFVYHSHVLEHFSRDEAPFFISECNRVLKPGGILRIAIPDLEQIAKEYLQALERAVSNEPNADADYEWMLLEMYDQTVRNESGGNMAKYLYQPVLVNEAFIYKRIGEEGRNLREAYFNNKNSKPIASKLTNFQFFKKTIRSILFFPTLTIKKYRVRKNPNEIYCKIGKFRLGGEIHQWMYDRYSIAKLLNQNGFLHIEQKQATESLFSEWGKYNLDITQDKQIRKPDSLFMEAKK